MQRKGGGQDQGIKPSVSFKKLSPELIPSVCGLLRAEYGRSRRGKGAWEAPQPASTEQDPEHPPQPRPPLSSYSSKEEFSEQFIQGLGWGSPASRDILPSGDFQSRTEEGLEQALLLPGIKETVRATGTDQLVFTVCCVMH